MKNISKTKFDENCDEIILEMNIDESKKRNIIKINNTFINNINRLVDGFNYFTKQEHSEEEYLRKYNQISEKIETTTNELHSKIKNNYSLIDSQIEKRYDKTLNEVNNKMKLQNSSFDEQFSQLTELYRLDLDKIEKRFNSYNLDISNMNFKIQKSIEAILSKNQKKILTLKKELDKRKQNLDDEFHSSLLYDYDLLKKENLEAIQNLRLNHSSYEELLFEKRKQLNSNLQKLSISKKEQLENDLIKVNTQKAYLIDLLEKEKVEHLETTNVILNDFKLQLEKIDNKIATLQSKKNISNEDNNEIQVLRKEKLIYDIQKEKILSDTITSNKFYERVLNNEIKLVDKKISLIEEMNELNYNLRFNKLKRKIAIEEERIKYKTNCINTEIDQEQVKFRENFDVIKKIDDNLRLIYQHRLNYETFSYDLKVDEEITASSLEINKYERIKEFNLELSQIKQGKVKLEQDFLNENKNHNFSILNIDNSFKMKNLQQDFQVASKFKDRNKQITNLNLEYELNKALIEQTTKKIALENEMLSDRLIYRTKRFNQYTNFASQFILEFKDYLTKFQSITKSKKADAAIKLSDYIFNITNYIINNIINNISDIFLNSMEFEKNLNLVIEVQNLEKELADSLLNFTNYENKINETISNYRNTITIFEKKKKTLQKEYDLNQETLLVQEYRNKTKQTSKNRENLKNLLAENKKEMKNFDALIKKNYNSIRELESVKVLQENNHKFAINTLKQQLSKANNSIEHIENSYKELNVFVNNLKSELNKNKLIHSPHHFAKYKRIIKSYNKLISSLKFNYNEKFVKVKKDDLNSRIEEFGKLKTSNLDQLNLMHKKELQELNYQHKENTAEISKKRKKFIKQNKKDIFECNENFEIKIKKLQKIRKLRTNEAYLKRKFFFDIKCIDDNLELTKQLNNDKIAKASHDLNNNVVTINSKNKNLKLLYNEKIMKIKLQNTSLMNEFKAKESKNLKLIHNEYSKKLIKNDNDIIKANNQFLSFVDSTNSENNIELKYKYNFLNLNKTTYKNDLANVKKHFRKIIK